MKIYNLCDAIDILRFAQTCGCKFSSPSIIDDNETSVFVYHLPTSRTCPVFDFDLSRRDFDVISEMFDLAYKEF